MKKVFYDNQIFSIQKAGGISRYFTELKNQMPSFGYQPNDSLYLTHNIFHKKRIPFFENVELRGRARVQRKFNSLIDRWQYLNNSYDIIHPTYFMESHFPKGTKAKKVITIYDMIHERFSHHFNDSLEISTNKRNLALEADLVLTISNKTKQDIVELLNISPDKIKITYLASSLNNSGTGSTLKSPEKYILFVGARGSYKSFNDFIINAASTLIKYQVTLYCVGGNEFTESELSLIENLHLKKYIVQKNLSDSELTLAYRNALLFTFPSIYEGFGIPILEAFENNCPILLSNQSCFPEIALDAAHYFDHFEDLPGILEKLISNSDFRNEKSSLQKLRAKDFSWAKTAQQTALAYNGLF